MSQNNVSPYNVTVTNVGVTATNIKITDQTWINLEREITQHTYTQEL